MSSGIHGRIARINLSAGSDAGAVEDLQLPADVYRTFMGGSALGSWFLLKEITGPCDPLSPENILTIAPGPAAGAAISGASRCCITALSPETGGVGDSQLGGSIAPMIKRAGYDALVISGKAEKPVYIFIDDGKVEIRDAAHLHGKTVLEAHDAITEEHGSRRITVLQCGPAGEKQVRFACLIGDFNNAAGRSGMGAVFGSKNLRAVVIRNGTSVNFHDNEAMKAMGKKGATNLPGSGFPETLKALGTPGVVGPQAEHGNLATHNFSRSWHPDYKNLHGGTYDEAIGAGHTTCFGCVIGCRKKVKADTPYPVTDRLGGPEFETLGLLGSNLDITDPVAVSKANELCNNYGIDTISMGGVAAWLMECMENGLISAEKTGGRSYGFGDPEGLFDLIEKTARREGVGDLMAEGVKHAAEKSGSETARYAIHVKNKVPAIHMAQVKPSMALMYAVCPIGADHMSSEHDWLLTSESELARGLSILGGGEISCADLNKARMTVYSQYFYSALDALSLCMFCWGVGALYSYRDLEDLVNAATGWQTTLFELMKLGERRVIMMRQINARQGLTAADDDLPRRLFEALPDGPAKGRCVEEDKFPLMRSEYYAMTGLDPETGAPTTAKLKELGLEWVLGG